ncbi:hypothetical protein [Clostridium saccharobutylicum]|uniref:Uncharacterized protein n=1 Tax=Clostridium saccharobutylicum TaxID=169679 RepID=A0A1S8N262_CLOSA|nr:hypothetical protein [Clostridium saccharobutylicum]OOM10503.1 hypothetical protein CLOSAC_31240 [Clostridium saccharobutylicum]
MLDSNDTTYEDDIKFTNFDSFNKEKSIFISPDDGRFPQGGNPSPGFNYPGGSFNPPGMPKSPPPNYTPKKNDKGVQKFTQTGAAPGTKAVSQNSIKFCLFKYTYIWETSGRSYWAFLLSVDKISVSGFRWFRGRWVYFGVDLRRIDSFVCYRSTSEDNCDDCSNYRSVNKSLQNTNKEFSLSGTKDIYTHILASIDVPEIKEDFIAQTIGYIADDKIESNIPCLKARNMGCRIILEIKYPSDYDTSLKKQINELANKASIDAYKSVMNNNKYSQLEIFKSSPKLIPELLENFSNLFNSKLKSLDSSSDNYNGISYSIREEKINNNWKSYSV